MSVGITLNPNDVTQKTRASVLAPSTDNKDETITDVDQLAEVHPIAGQKNDYSAKGKSELRATIKSVDISKGTFGNWQFEYPKGLMTNTFLDETPTKASLVGYGNEHIISLSYEVVGGPPYYPTHVYDGASTFDTQDFFDLGDTSSVMDKLNVKMSIDPTGLPPRFGNLTGGQKFEVFHVSVSGIAIVGGPHWGSGLGGQYWWWPSDNVYVRTKWPMGAGKSISLIADGGVPYISLIGASRSTRNRMIPQWTSPFWDGEYVIPQMGSFIDSFGDWSPNNSGFDFFGMGGSNPIKMANDNIEMREDISRGGGDLKKATTGMHRLNQVGFQGNYTAYGIMWMNLSGSVSYAVLAENLSATVRTKDATGIRQSDEKGRISIETIGTVQNQGQPNESFVPITATGPVNMFISNSHIGAPQGSDVTIPPASVGSGLHLKAGFSGGDDGCGSSTIMTGGSAGGSSYHARSAAVGFFYMVGLMPNTGLLSGASLPSPLLGQPETFASSLSIPEKAASSERKDPSRTFVINFDTGTLTESRVNRSRFYNTVNVDKERLLLGVDWSRQSISKFMEGYDDDGLPVTRTYVSGLNDIGDPFIWKNLYVVGVEADDAGQIEVTLFDENEGRLKTFTIQGGTISVWDGFNWDAGMWAGDFASTGTEVGRVATMLGRRYGFSLLTKTSGLYIIRALRLTVRPRSERFGRGRWK